MEQRSQVELQKFGDTLPPAIFDCTDGFKNYAELVWPQKGQHLVSVQKEQTHTIEWSNAQLRTYLGRLKRRSRCFSRCLLALQRAIRLFVWHYNRRQRKIRSEPKKYQNRLTLLF